MSEMSQQWITSTALPVLTPSLNPSSLFWLTAPPQELAAARGHSGWKDLCECEKEQESGWYLEQESDALQGTVDQGKKRK